MPFRSDVEKLEYTVEITDLLINTFPTRSAVQVTVEILTAIGCNQVAEELKSDTESGERSKQARFQFRCCTFQLGRAG